MAYVFFILNQYKGNNSRTTDAILTKLDMHQRIKVIYAHLKLHQIPLVDYLVMAPDVTDGITAGRNDGRTETEKTISLRLRRL